MLAQNALEFSLMRQSLMRQSQATSEPSKRSQNGLEVELDLKKYFFSDSKNPNLENMQKSYFCQYLNNCFIYFHKTFQVPYNIF